ncbi:MAG: hypothetical protein QW575_07345 [Thermoproteota archaeon]
MNELKAVLEGAVNNGTVNGFHNDLEQYTVSEMVNVPIRILEVAIINTRYGEMVKMLVEGKETKARAVVRSTSQIILRQVKALADKGLIPTQGFVVAKAVKTKQGTTYKLEAV